MSSIFNLTRGREKFGRLSKEQNIKKKLSERSSIQIDT